MPGHEDPKGHVEIIDGKAVLVLDEKVVVKKEEVKAKPVVEKPKKTYSYNKKEK